MTMTIRFAEFLCLSTLAIGSLAGCGAAEDGTLQEGTSDENIAQSSDALNLAIPFRLHNFDTNLCVGVQAGTPNHGQPLITWGCDGSTNQTWTKGQTIAAHPAFFQLVNGVITDPTRLKCLDSFGATNGTQSRIGNCVQHGNQGWQPVFRGTDLMGRECFRFHLAASPNKVLGVQNGNTAPGSRVMIWDNDGKPNQIWCVGQ